MTDKKYALKMTHKNGRAKGFDNGKDWYLKDPRYARLNIPITNTCEVEEVRVFDNVNTDNEFNKMFFVEGSYTVEEWRL